MSRWKRMMAAAIGVSLLAPMVASATQAATRVDDPYFTLHVTSVNVSGCPAGSSVLTQLPNQTAFTVSFSEFRAYGGKYKNCVVSIDVGIPASWTYAVWKQC